jgi:Transposase DDE domain
VGHLADDHSARPTQLTHAGPTQVVQPGTAKQWRTVCRVKQDLKLRLPVQRPYHTWKHGATLMATQNSLLIDLLLLVDRVPQPPAASRRGRPRVYSERLFLKALVIMILRHLPTVHALLAVLDQPEMAAVRALLSAAGRFPTRRTWERRLKAIPATLPAQIACLGERLVIHVQPWAKGGRAAAIDSTPLRARGGVWHKHDREAGIVPHTSIDTEAHWTHSGWHGVYGWKLHLLVTVASDVWIPLAADLTPTNVADNEYAPALLDALVQEDLFILGDTSYHDPALRDLCAAHHRMLVTTQRRPYPHTDDGVAVRRLFHQLRTHAIENFYSQFKAIFDCGGQVRTKGLCANRRFVLGAVFVYQLALLYRFDTGGSLRVGLKPLLQAA